MRFFEKYDNLGYHYQKCLKTYVFPTAHINGYKIGNPTCGQGWMFPIPVIRQYISSQINTLKLVRKIFSSQKQKPQHLIISCFCCCVNKT